MKRLIVTIDGKPAGPEQIRNADRAASREWSAHGRSHRTAARRAHRKLTEEQREEKRSRTAQRKREREAQRAAREHEALMRRLKFAVARATRQAEQATKIKVKYKPGREPRFRTVCPRALYRRVHPFRPPMSNRPARAAADGFRNVVLKRSSRGFGRRAPGTRSYQAGEASRAARYIARPEGIEDVEGAVLTNVLGPNLICERSFSIEQQQRIAGFFDALESIERATGFSHVFSHNILALPLELGPDGRAEAMRQICGALHRLRIPFSAALHKPDAEGNQRNFHAHIVMGTRPFDFEAEYSWSFDAQQYSELISGPGTQWLRGHIATAFNDALKVRNSPIKFTGKSQADRGLSPTDDSHKGQKVVAMERAAAEDAKLAHRLVSFAASHAIMLVDQIRALGRELSTEHGTGLPDVQKRKDEERLVVPDASQPDPGAIHIDLLRDADALLLEAKRERRKAELAQNSRDRRDIVMASLSQLPETERSVAVEDLVVALSRTPQTLALALRDGVPQVAYRDKALEPALREAVYSRTVLHWLSDLAGSLNFDHAIVPASWHYASLRQDWLLLPSRAEHWAPQYGGIKANEEVMYTQGHDQDIGR